MAKRWIESGTNHGQLLLVAVLLVAVTTRMAAALFLGDATATLPGTHDEISYDLLARRVLAGQGFSFAEGHWPATRGGEPTAHWSYLYTLYLAGVFALNGGHVLGVRLLQATIVGLLHIWLVWRIGRRIFGTTVAMVAAGWTTLYAYFVYYAGALVTEAFYIVAVLWTFDVALRISAQAWGPKTDAGAAGTRWLWIELGLAIGVATLLRQIFLLFVPILFAWILLGGVISKRQLKRNVARSTSRSAIQGLLLSTLVVVFLIAPWTIRNYRVFGLFVPLNTNVGFALYWGNHPIHGRTFMPILPADQPSYGALLPDELRRLNEAALDKALLIRAFKFIADDPARYAILSIGRAREYFKFWPSPQSGNISNIARVGSFGVSLPFILFGLYRCMPMVRHWPDAQKRHALRLLFSWIVFYTTIHLLSWTLIRYRLPVDAILLFFAAYGAVAMAHSIDRQLLSRRTGFRWHGDRSRSLRHDSISSIKH